MTRTYTQLILIVAVVAGLALLPGCAKKPKPVVAPEPTPPVMTPEPAQPDQTTRVEPEPGIAPVPGDRVGAEELPADIEALNRAGYVKDVFFDSNKSDLSADARDTLAANASWLKAHPSVELTIEGHADERNTSEYNLALGWRRANAAKEYLVALGVDAGRIETISYGEERPFATCNDESCWSQNRRAHLVITAR